MSRPRIELRSCRDQDIDAVLALWEGVATPRSPTDQPNALRRPIQYDHPDALRKCIQHDPGLFLLAWDESRLAGSLMAGWDGWRGTIYRLAVDREYRRMGIARRLVEAVEGRLRELGAERVSTLVVNDEEPANTFWRRAGYSPQRRIVRYVRRLA